MIAKTYSRKMPEFAFFSSISGRRALIFGLVAGLFLVFAFMGFVKDVLVILGLAALGIFSTYYKRLVRVPPAVELVTFGTVLVGVAYGPIAGAIFGAIVTLAAEILNSGIDFFIISYIPARAVVGFLSSFFPDSGMVALGSSMSLAYNALAQPLYAFQGDAELRMKLLLFVIVNVSFNFIAFSLLGEFAKSLIT